MLKTHCRASGGKLKPPAVSSEGELMMSHDMKLVLSEVANSREWR